MNWLLDPLGKKSAFVGPEQISVFSIMILGDVGL